MWETIYQTAVELGWVQWLAFIFGLLYIGLASQNKISCWFFGILSAGLWTYAAFFQYQLYMDAGLNFFYVIMGFIGWVNWSKGQSEEQLPITALSRRSNLRIIGFGVLGTALLGYALSMYTDAALPFWDALTTIFSVVATFLLIKRQIDNWIYWILTDAIYVGMYYYREAYLFGILFVVYTLMAIIGWIEWRREKSAYIEHI